MYGYATYTYKEGLFIYTIEGLIRDLSETGCDIRGMKPQGVGSQIRVMLSLRDQQPPLCVSRAIVSWVAGDCFGIKFPKLKPQEYELLLFFAEHKGQMLSREFILDRVWGWDFIGDSRTVDVHVRWLRQKIEPDPSNPQYILTVFGVGYRFVSDREWAAR